MPYDCWGWIVNWNVRDRIFEDRGDSCFFMGLQALNFILAGRVDLAKELYERVKRYDFVRHPSVLSKETAGSYWKNQTSLDMMLIWDYIAYRYGEDGFEPPPFHYRRSKFFWGKFRSPFLYSKIVGSIFLSVLLFLWRFRRLREYYQKNYHRLHLVILYLATVFEKNKSDFNIQEFFLYKFQNFIKDVEREYNYKNPFFRFLARMEIDEDNSFKLIHNSCEWIYQRYPCERLESREDKIFHSEKVDIVLSLFDSSVILKDIELDLSEQFWFLVVKRAKIIFK